MLVSGHLIRRSVRGGAYKPGCHVVPASHVWVAQVGKAQFVLRIGPGEEHFETWLESEGRKPGTAQLYRVVLLQRDAPDGVRQTGLPAESATAGEHHAK